MSTIITRAGKGTPLTYIEADANFTNLNNDKLEKNGGTLTGGAIENTTIGATTASSGKFTSLEALGNPTLSTSSSYIYGNNLRLQSTTTNSNNVTQIIPNGTSTTSGIRVLNSSDISNNAYMTILATNSEARLGSQISGTGSYLPMTFYTGGSERARLDTSGNLGIGKTPSYKLDVNGSVAINNAQLVFVGTSTPPSLVKDRSIRFDITNAGGLDADNPWWSGYHINTPDPIVVGANTGYPRGSFYWNYDSATNPTNLAFNIITGNNATGGSSSLKLGNDSAGPIIFVTSATEKARFTSTGELLLNGTSSLSSKLGVYGGALGTNSGDQVMLERNSTTSSNVNYLEISEIRTSAGSGWTTSASRIQRKIDATWHSYLQFGGTGIEDGISIGTGSNTTSANTTIERLRIDNAGKMTLYGGAGSTQLEMRNGGDLLIYNADNTKSATLYCDVDQLLYQDQRLVNSSLYYRLESNGPTLANATATTPIAIFGVGVTLQSNTVYEFEYRFLASKTAGATSHAVRINFAGTVTYNNITYIAHEGVTPINTVDSSASIANGNVATVQTISDASATTALTRNVLVKGTMSISSGGTWIPQFSMSASPGGDYVVQLGGYVKVTPIGVAGSNTNIGSWA